MGRQQNTEQHIRFKTNSAHALQQTKATTRRGRWLRGFTVTLGIGVLLLSGTTQAIASSEETPTTDQQQTSSFATQESDSGQGGAEPEPTAAPEDTDAPEDAAPPEDQDPQPTPGADDSMQETDQEELANEEEPQETKGLSAQKKDTPAPQPQAVSMTTIRITKVGDRTGAGLTSGAPLSGATFDAYASTSSGSNGQPTGASLGSCVTAANGKCDIQLPNGSQPNGVWVKETSPPAGFYPSMPIGTGLYSSAKTSTPYQFRVTLGTGTSDVLREVPRDKNLPSGAISDVWVNSRVNSAFPEICGLSIAMVFDTSTSMSPSDMQTLKTAARAFVSPDGLGGTPSKVTMFQFNTAAQTMNGGVPFDLATAGTPTTGYTGAMNAITSQLPSSGSGYTNWDGAFRLIKATGNYDGVLFLTDGDPTIYVGGSLSTSVQFRQVEQAIMSANTVKASVGPGGVRTKIAAVGVGLETNSHLNLQAISGPTQGSDYFLASEIDELKAVLKEISSKNCDGTLTVIKELQDAQGVTTNANAAGWEFTAAGAVVDGTPKSQTTVSGTNFAMTFPTLETAEVTVTETPQPGYEYFGTTCSDEAGPITETGNSFTVTVNPNATTSCTVVNRQVPASVSATKKWVITDSAGDVLRTAHIPAQGTDDPLPAGLSAQLTLSGPQDAAASNQDWGAAREGYTIGDNVTVDEEASIDADLLPGCEMTSQLITSIGGEVLADPLQLAHEAAVGPGENTFEITNTLSCATSLTLLKHVPEGNAAAADWSLTATLVGSDPVNSTTVPGAETEGTANTFEVIDNQNYVLTEELADPQAPLAYRLDRIEKCELEAGECTWTLVDGAAGVSVDIGQHEMYRFVNVPLPLLTIPLTGGVSTDMLAISGGIAAMLALLIGVWYWRYSTRSKLLS